MSLETISEKRYSLPKPDDRGGATFELSHFFDMKKEYIQHCPPGFLNGLDKMFAESPILLKHGPRDCLLKAKKIYLGDLLDEEFKNSQEKRKQVKFGLLLDYPLNGQ